METDAGKSAWRGALLTASAALAACAPAWLILRYGVDVPYWDHWDLAPFFERLARGTLTAADLFAQQNEYRQFFPNLLFVALGRLTGWNVRAEMLACLLLACAAALGVRSLAARTSADPSGGRAGTGGVQFLLASLFIFSAVQYENWLFGVQVVYFVPGACVTAGLVSAYSERLGARASVFVCACLAAVATFSSANGVVCWLVLPLAILAARPEARASARRWLPLWGACLGLCLAAYVYGYHTPKGHPAPSEAVTRPVDALIYLSALSGGPLALGPRPLPVAVAAGACALAAYAFACAYLLRHRNDAALVRRAGAWVALGAYSVVTAAMVTAGRLGFGVAQSLSSRYTTFTLYLLVALVYLLPCVAWHAARRGRGLASRAALLRRLGAAAAVLLVLAHVAAFVLVVKHGAAPTRRARLRAKACLLFVEAAPNERCLAEGLHPNVPKLRARAAALDRLGYLRPPLVKDGRMKALAPDGFVCSDAYGEFVLARSTSGDVITAGSARLPHRRGEPADAIVLAHGSGEDDQTAFALAAVERGETMGAKADDESTHWVKMFPPAALPSGVVGGWFTAWAFDAEEGKAYRLCGGGSLPPAGVR
ncbi:MAG: hypothetical protein LC795_10630 [Acidobacteria bacterium]|nr:hypothetical protein [Acidobacteriota bacterium]MCA1619745.1 hypothetical protein [Acidobacteriota bacterium]